MIERMILALGLSMVGLAAEAGSVAPLPPARPSANPSGPETIPLPVPRPPDLKPETPLRPASPGAALNGPPASPVPLPGRPEPSRPTWTTPLPGIRDAPSSNIPGAFPVDEMDAACTRILASGKIVASRMRPILDDNGCGIAFPIELRAIVARDGQRIELKPPPILRCDLAEVLADWTRDDLEPLRGDQGRLVGLMDAAAYVCRGRNNVPGAPMSEHGRGDAIDILGLDFANQSVGLRQDDAHALWAQVKTSACARFNTVLGPGSDGYHENNLHLDLEDRRNRSHYCHWDHP